MSLANLLLKCCCVLVPLVCAPATHAVLPGQVIELGSSRGAVHVPEVTDGTAGAGMGWGAHAGVVLRKDGTLRPFGRTLSGDLLTVPAGLSDVIQLEGGEMHIIALRRDGTVVTFPSISVNGFSLDAPAGLTHVRSIAAGRSRCYAVREDGTVAAWGEVTVPGGLTNIAQISAGEGGYDVALRKDGTVLAWEQPHWGLMNNVSVPAGLSDVIAVSAGYSHALALRSDGTVVTWGTNAGVPATTPDGLSDVVQIVALENFSAARKRDGSVVIWGGGYFGQTMRLPQNFYGASSLFADRTVLYAVAAPRELTAYLPFSMHAGDDLALAAPSGSLNPTTTYQWRREGVDISGATNAELILPYLQTSDRALYDVTMRTGDLTTTSAAADVSVLSGDGRSAYLSNISTRGVAGQGESTMIAGFVVRAASARTMMIRGVGPGLAIFGVSGVLPDPQVDLRFQGNRIGFNEDWEAQDNSDALSQFFAELGAFPLAHGAKDGALRVNVLQNAYTVFISGQNASRGIALAECYDQSYVTESFDLPYGGAITGKLTNISTRAEIGTGDEVLIGGFVLGGQGSQRLLIRGVGPELRAHGVHNAASRTRLTVRQGNRIVATNSGWSTQPNAGEIAAAGQRLGAFDLSDQSGDSAALLELQPGIYTVIVEALDPLPTIGLVEIYEDDTQ